MESKRFATLSGTLLFPLCIGCVDPVLYLSQQGEIEQKLRTLRRLRQRIMDSTGEDTPLSACGKAEAEPL